MVVFYNHEKTVGGEIMENKEMTLGGTPEAMKPVFADNILLTFQPEESTDSKERHGHLRLTFTDMSRGQVVSEIVVSRIHAKKLVGLLQTKLSEIDTWMQT